MAEHEINVDTALEQLMWLKDDLNDIERNKTKMALRMHPREKLINDAEVKLLEAVVKWLESPEANALTEWEGARVLNSVFGLQINSLTKFAIRNERHGDEDKEGGLA